MAIVFLVLLFPVVIGAAIIGWLSNKVYADKSKKILALNASAYLTFLLILFNFDLVEDTVLTSDTIAFISIFTLFAHMGVLGATLLFLLIKRSLNKLPILKTISHENEKK
jgi:hypothetical protein